MPNHAYLCAAERRNARMISRRSVYMSFPVATTKPKPPLSSDEQQGITEHNMHFAHLRTCCTIAHVVKYSCTG